MTRLTLSSLALLAAITANGQKLTPAWVEMGEGGQAIVRVVVRAAADCPAIQIDGRPLPMRLRQPVPDGFSPACEATLPRGLHAATVDGQKLHVPRPNPSRVIALGDTGCRVKGAEIQACNDPQQWPFAQVAAKAAIDRPDLVIHVGDYLYRESPCPAPSQAMCGGTPVGDNWAAWDADFFTPAARLLATAPWAFSRGNHEDCARSWRGWFYYLDPRPFTGTCERYTAPYTVTLGNFTLVMFDSSAVSPSTLVEEQAAAFAAQLAQVHVQHAWLADHHPFWGLRTDNAADQTASVSPTLQEAWERAHPKGIDLLLSGHTHLFELLDYGPTRPVQLVAGDGGTDLAAPVSGDINGMSVHGTSVVIGASHREFGFTVLTRIGQDWKIRLKTYRDRLPDLHPYLLRHRSVAETKRVVN